MAPRRRRGANRFHTDWKEPKLLILYVVGDDGRPSQTWAPIIDGTLRGPEAVFALLLSYARQIGLNAADKVLFIADGAPWIWRRLQRLIAALGLSPTQVLGLIVSALNPAASFVNRPALPTGVAEREELTETGLWSTARCRGRRRHRQANSVRVCAPTSRRVASLRPPLRGADGLDAGSAHARPDWLLPTMLTYTPPTCCGRRPVQNDALSGDR